MDQEKLERFYKGECTPEEVKAVMQWFKSQSLAPEQEQELARFWAGAGEQQTSLGNLHNADQTWRNIQAAIQKPEYSTQPEAKVIPLHSTNWTKWMQIAASILLPVGLIWFLASNYFSKNITIDKVVAVQTGTGERKTIQLPDGSTITLRPNSKVSYQEPFADYRRDITLEGEAFFEVAKDSLRPFVVKSGTIYTQALGTSFNIKYLPKDTAISVALATGKVKIDQGALKVEKTLTYLEPGQQLIYMHQQDRFAVGAFDAREVLGWKDGILYFKKASLEEVVTKIEEWYGVEVQIVGDPPRHMKNWSYTGEYIQQDLPKVLEGISFVKQFSYKMTDHTVYLTFKKP